MTEKKTEDQKSHDECVRVIANQLKNEQWDVKANLEDWQKPDSIGATTPDIEASKGGCVKRICEVATEDMFAGDKTKYIELKNYCDEYDFRMYVVDKDGKRKEIDPQTFGKKTKP